MVRYRDVLLKVVVISLPVVCMAVPLGICSGCYIPDKTAAYLKCNYLYKLATSVPIF